MSTTLLRNSSEQARKRIADPASWELLLNIYRVGAFDLSLLNAYTEIIDADLTPGSYLHPAHVSFFIGQLERSLSADR